MEAHKAFSAALKKVKGFGAKDPRRPTTFLNLAEVYLKQGRYGRADRLCLRAQTLLGKIHGPKSLAAARALNLRAKVLAMLGQITRPEKLARRALTIREKKFGKNHPEVADSLDTLADLGRAEVKTTTKRAIIYTNISIVDRSLAVREKVLGKNHPSLVPTLLTLARELNGQTSEQIPVAEKYLQRAMDIITKNYGPDHPDLGECLTLQAWGYRELGKYREAEQDQQKGLAILKKFLGPRHPKVGLGLYNLALIRLAQGREKRVQQLFHDGLSFQFSGLQDEELCHYFKGAEPPGTVADLDSPVEPSLNHRESFLNEMVQRGGPTIERFLKRWHKKVLARRVKAIKKARLSRTIPFDLPSNLEILNALRRLQKKDDPLEINISDATPFECIFPRLPDFGVALTNEDVHEKVVGFQEWGDYRSGRQERWRFEVRDTKGNRIPVKGSPSFEGGGLSNQGNLKHDQSWNTTLHMESFVDLVPGEYTLTIQYHDRLCIASKSHLAGLIVCRSKPFRLLVQPRVIDLTRQDKSEAEKWLAKLDDKAELKVLVGDYGKHFHKFIPPTAPAAKLLSLGWKAVPSLLNALDKKDPTPTRRAWVLALLFSITRFNDPRQEDGVLGKYSYAETGWALWGGRDGRMDFSGSGWQENGEWDQGEIDKAAQGRFLKRWQAFKDYIVVRNR
jgi:tetratricopeptide (TPR) repeat protein